MDIETGMNKPELIYLCKKLTTKLQNLPSFKVHRDAYLNQVHADIY